jgi:hypothetical protein
MNKRTNARLRAFQTIQLRNAGYHISQYTPHEQAINEHIRRGYGDGLLRMAGLLDQKNKI